MDMSEFSFDEEKKYKTSNNQSSKQSALIKLVIKLSGGRVQNTRQASIVLLAVLVICIFLIVILNTGNSTEIDSSEPDPSTLFDEDLN